MVNVHVISNVNSTLLSYTESIVNTIHFDDDIQALNSVEEYKPSVVLLNYDFKGEQTPNYIGHLLAASTVSKVVVVGSDLSDNHVLKCLISGAKGYQEIETFDDYAEKIIRVIDAGEAWITRRLVAILLDSLRS